jgi:hypothetical protein
MDRAIWNGGAARTKKRGPLWLSGNAQRLWTQGENGGQLDDRVLGASHS